MEALRAWARAGVIVACGIVWTGLWAAAGSAASLPDGRGYELVSPPDKNGGDVMASYHRVRTAVDGSAAAFASLSTTGDALGTGIATDYLSERTGSPGTQGWASHAITPPQPAMSYRVILLSLETAYQGDFSANLTKGVLRAWSPLTEAPFVANVANLYVRDDLRTPGPGSYALLSDCPICTSPLPSTLLPAKPLFVAASVDFGRVLFESSFRLAAGAGAGLNAYEWDHGTLRLAGVLPNGSPAPSAAVGGLSGDPSDPSYLGERAISDDGRKMFFSAPPNTSSTSLYMRLDGSQTAQLNASERAVPDAAQAARFEDASSDGSRVFFLTAQALTDDAPVNGNRKLYVYDTTKPASDPHNLTYVSVDNGPDDVSNDVQGVVGASADGHTVYFLDRTQLVPGGPPTSLAIFAWHDGTISYVSDIAAADAGELRRDTDSDKLSRVAADGDLLFSARLATGPTGYDQGDCGGSPCRELYLYRLATHIVSCVSCNPSGAPATADATDFVVSGAGGSSGSVREARVISDDGSKVLFSTAEALVPEDVNGVSDAYEYDATTGQVHLISSGTDPSPSYGMELTPDGRDMFFVTRQRLVGWDVDDLYDLYDARVGGGFPDPPPVAPPCSGRACQGVASVAPADLASGSELLVGAGNASARLHPHGVRRARRCVRGRVRRVVHGRAKCVVARKQRTAHAKSGRAVRSAGERRAG